MLTIFDVQFWDIKRLFLTMKIRQYYVLFYYASINSGSDPRGNAWLILGGSTLIGAGINVVSYVANNYGSSKFSLGNGYVLFIRISHPQVLFENSWPEKIS